MVGSNEWKDQESSPDIYPARSFLDGPLPLSVAMHQKQSGRLIADPKNSEDVVAYIIRLFKLDRNLAEQFYRRLVASLSLTGMVEMDKIRLAIESAVERGVIDKPVDPVMVVDFSIARKLDQK